jgi:outer membrane protease
LFQPEGVKVKMQTVKKIIISFLIVLIVLINTLVFAGVEKEQCIQFRDGRVVQGYVIGMDTNIVKIKTSAGKIVFRLADDIISVKDCINTGRTVGVKGKSINLSNISSVQPAPRLFTEFGLSTRYINGDSTYHIRFNDSWANGGHGESELEFPYDNFMTGITLAVGSRYVEKPKQIRGLLTISFFYSPSMDSGTMKDSDWIENDAAFGEAPHAGKDCYTESDAEFTGLIFDINYAYHFSLNKNLTLGPMIGYKQMDFSFDIYGYSGAYWTTPVSGTGKVLEYDVHYKLPYIGLSSNLLFGKKDQFQLNFTFGYSPWAKVKDSDDHLLRYKLSEGDCDGHAYLANINMAWNFYSTWSLGLGVEYVNIDTSGKQHQSWYDGPSAGATIDVDDDKITSSYWSAMFSVSYAFF